jgi:glutamate-1-semialdehyde 2,1-aminomutase
VKSEKSALLYKQAKKLLVGGVNSPVRAFKAVGGTPRFIKEAKGSKIKDADGNSYIDYVCSWGALILGSAHPKVVNALKRQLIKGTSYGAPTELETRLAGVIIDAVPSIERIRFVNSGTEATMAALRLARAYTKRPKILKFEGCYHGHVDSLLVKGGSGMATFSVPDSAGITNATAADTLVCPFNDIEHVKATFEESDDEIAAVIVEPVAANMGLVPPSPAFLHGLREATKNHGALLIFDEVVTGFRVSYGGAQAYHQIKPDITCLGKIIGGGLPVGAYGGAHEVMGLLAPEGPVYQAGTLAGNPLAMTAGIATLTELKPALYDRLERSSSLLEKNLVKASHDAECPLSVNRVGSMLGLFFTDRRVVDYASAKSSDTASYSVFFHSMLSQGIYLPPSQFETIFVSATHSPADITETVDAARVALEKTRTEATELMRKVE